MRFLFCWITFSICFYNNTAQTSNDDFSSRVAFRTETMDDFFDRFDFKVNKGFLRYLKNKYPFKPITRQNLISSLFNSENKELDPEKKMDFIVQVTDSFRPCYLDYSDQDWYAELKCRIIYKGVPKKLTLIMKVEKTEDDAFSWNIVSCQADFLRFKNIKSDSLILKKQYEKFSATASYSSQYFYTPVSHNLDFMNADEAFIHKNHINDYLYSGKRSFELLKLLSLIEKSSIRFQQVDTVRYHLLQIDDWILVVNYFNRKNLNSGWLIDSLIHAVPEQKNEYKNKILNIPPN